MKSWIFPLLAIVAGLGAACFGQSTQESNPLAGRLKGMTCDIWEESGPSFGVLPHVRAADELQAIACMGYLHGRDRAWQMDFLKRIAQGRRAEIQGFAQVTEDFEMRLLGLDMRARRVFAAMTPAQQEALWAYAYGVNRGLRTEQAKNAYEFKVLGYQPEPWKPSDSILILLLQSFDQSEQTFTRRIQEAGWLKQDGAMAPALFARSGLPWDTTILKEGEYPTRNSGNRGAADIPLDSTGGLGALTPVKL